MKDSLKDVSKYILIELKKNMMKFDIIALIYYCLLSIGNTWVKM